MVPTHLQQGADCGGQMQPLGTTTFLGIPGTFLLFLTDTICFLFSRPRKSLLLSE